VRVKVDGLKLFVAADHDLGELKLAARWYFESLSPGPQYADCDLMPNKELERRGAIPSPVQLPDEDVSPGDEGEWKAGCILGSQLLEEVLPTYHVECPHWGWGRLRDASPLQFRTCPDCGAYLTRAAVEEDRQCWRDQRRRLRYIPNEQRAVFWHIFNIAALSEITSTVDTSTFELMKRAHCGPVIICSSTVPVVHKKRAKSRKGWEIAEPKSLASILLSRLTELKRWARRRSRSSPAPELPRQRQHRDGLQRSLSDVELKNNGFMNFGWDERARKWWWKHAGADDRCICQYGHTNGRKAVEGLPEDVVRLRALGLTYSEIARRLGKLESEIRLLVRRASTRAASSEARLTGTRSAADSSALVSK